MAELLGESAVIGWAGVWVMAEHVQPLSGFAQTLKAEIGRTDPPPVRRSSAAEDRPG